MYLSPSYSHLGTYLTFLQFNSLTLLIGIVEKTKPEGNTRDRCYFHLVASSGLSARSWSEVLGAPDKNISAHRGRFSITRNLVARGSRNSRGRSVCSPLCISVDAIKAHMI